MKKEINNRPLVLVILDGWGHSDQNHYNPTLSTPTPKLNELIKNYPHRLLDAAGEAVCLPAGQMGNSEVGHLHIGAGRKVPQDLMRIDTDILTGDFFQNKILTHVIQTAKQHDKAVHILGLLSPGGVHSHEHQIIALLDLIAEQEVNKSYLHAILDGRDVPPQSALASLKKVDAHYRSLDGGCIASIMGRYYAMDRDQRWERTQLAYDAITLGSSITAETAEQAINNAYERGETDEFIKPCTIGKKPIIIEDGDVVIFMNFRADRARQLTRAFTEVDFKGFVRKKLPALSSFVTLTLYAKDIKAEVAYPPLPMENTLGEIISKHSLKQLRIAETEKYAHVTYFLNGGIEKPFNGEDRELIPSPKIATYDLQPEMSAIEVTDKLVEAIFSKKYDVIVCNYANPDMVGHTGVLDAANKAVSIIDTCIARIHAALKEVDGEMLITADHGNIEKMFDEQTGQPHTAHTTNQVPFIYVGRKAHFIAGDGALDDVAPTLLTLLGIEKPSEMKGRNLIQFDSTQDK